MKVDLTASDYDGDFDFAIDLIKAYLGPAPTADMASLDFERSLDNASDELRERNPELANWADHVILQGLVRQAHSESRSAYQ